MYLRRAQMRAIQSSLVRLCDARARVRSRAGFGHLSPRLCTYAAIGAVLHLAVHWRGKHPADRRG